MVENPLDNLRTDALLLIGLIHDHIPNRGPKNKVRENPAEADQAIAIPRTQRDIGMAKHLAGIAQRPPFGPGSLLKQDE